MSKPKVPSELHEIADELNLDLGDEVKDTEDLYELIEWVRFRIGEERGETVQHYDDLEARLDAVEADLDDLAVDEVAG